MYGAAFCQNLFIFFQCQVLTELSASLFLDLVEQSSTAFYSLKVLIFQLHRAIQFYQLLHLFYIFESHVYCLFTFLSICKLRKLLLFLLHLIYPAFLCRSFVTAYTAVTITFSYDLVPIKLILDSDGSTKLYYENIANINLCVMLELRTFFLKHNLHINLI